MARQQRRGGAGRAVAASLVFLVGVLVLAVGAGLGPRHLAKEGATATAVLGLVLLGLGAVLALVAAVRLLRGMRRRWWLLAVPLLLVVTYLVVWPVGWGVATAYPPRPPLGDRTPADVGLEHEDVTVTTEDGARLRGWYVPSTTGAAVVLRHGAGSTRSGVLDHAAVLAGHGYGVLMLDARGHGESGGRGMETGWFGERDTAAAVDLLLDRPDVDPGRVGLVGLSMGGEESLGAVGADDRVRAVVAEGASYRTSEDKGYLAEYGWRGDLQQQVDALTAAVTELLTPAPRPRSLRAAVRTATTRDQPAQVLLVTAAEVEEEGLAAEFIRASSPGVQVWEASGGHTRGLAEQPAAWESRVVGFLDEALGSQ